MVTAQVYNVGFNSGALAAARGERKTYSKRYIVERDGGGHLIINPRTGMDIPNEAFFSSLSKHVGEYIGEAEISEELVEAAEALASAKDKFEELCEKFVEPEISASTS